MARIRSLLKPLLASEAYAGEKEEGYVSRVRVGEYEFDLKSGELSSGKRRVILQRQPQRILTMLISYPGQFVTRDEIQQELWPDGVVVNFEVCINQAISKLRHAMNDSAVNPQFIETVGRRGYRLKVPVAVSFDQSNGETRFGNAVASPNLLQRLAEELTAACGREERERLTAALLRLLHILACVERPCEEPLLAVSHDGASGGSDGSAETGRS